MSVLLCQPKPEFVFFSPSGSALRHFFISLNKYLLSSLALGISLK